MDYNKLVEYRAKVRDNMDILLSNSEFELSIKYLVSIHEYLFKGILFNAGHFRHYNLEREEEILNLDTVDYPDFHTIPTYLRFVFRDEVMVDYSKMNMDMVITHIARFVSELWLIHPFGDGNTRTIGLFTEKYLKSMGYNVNHNVFRENARYFRDALVRATYSSDKVNPSNEALINFYNKVLVDSNIELNNDYLYIPEVFNMKRIKKKN